MADTTDMLLVRCRLASGDGLAEAARRWCEQAGTRLQRAAWSSGEQWAYVYATPSSPAVPARAVAELARSWSSLCPAATDTDVSRLRLAQDIAGRSHGETAVHHYVVETDPEAGWQDELARWYEQEHMPGLAAVPGCVRAQRFLNLDAGPASHACYGLVTEGTLGSPPWLAVRGTDWSSRVRPHFTNTRRTMMAIAA